MQGYNRERSYFSHQHNNEIWFAFVQFIGQLEYTNTTSSTLHECENSGSREMIRFLELHTNLCSSTRPCQNDTHCQSGTQYCKCNELCGMICSKIEQPPDGKCDHYLKEYYEIVDETRPLSGFFSNHETKQSSKFLSDPSPYCFTIDVWNINCWRQ